MKVIVYLISGGIATYNNVASVEWRDQRLIMNIKGTSYFQWQSQISTFYIEKAGIF